MYECSTNLTDNQWQVIEKIINAQERVRKHSLRDIMNAILYINKTGCQWRLLPREFGPWHLKSPVKKDPAKNIQEKKYLH